MPFRSEEESFLPNALPRRARLARALSPAHSLRHNFDKPAFPDSPNGLSHPTKGSPEIGHFSPGSELAAGVNTSTLA